MKLAWHSFITSNAACRWVKWTGKGYSHEEVIQEAPQAGGSLEEVVHVALHASLGVVRAVWEAGGGGKRDGGDGEGWLCAGGSVVWPLERRERLIHYSPRAPVKQESVPRRGKRWALLPPPGCAGRRGRSGHSFLVWCCCWRWTIRTYVHGITEGSGGPACPPWWDAFQWGCWVELLQNLIWHGTKPVNGEQIWGKF